MAEPAEASQAMAPAIELLGAEAVAIGTAVLLALTGWWVLRFCWRLASYFMVSAIEEPMSPQRQRWFDEKYGGE